VKSGKMTPGDMGVEDTSKRRDVSPLAVGLLEAGGSAQVIQEEMLKVSFAREEEAKAAGSILELLKRWDETRAGGIAAMEKLGVPPTASMDPDSIIGHMMKVIGR
jgi:hypothetical protein